MSITSIWKQRAKARRKEVVVRMHPINVFSAQGAELDSIGMMVSIERLSFPLTGRMKNAEYRRLIMRRVIDRLDAYKAQPHISPGNLDMNTLAVVLGTFRNDPNIAHHNQYPETDQSFLERLSMLSKLWWRTHGELTHKCQECEQ